MPTLVQLHQRRRVGWAAAVPLLLLLLLFLLLLLLVRRLEAFRQGCESLCSKVQQRGICCLLLLQRAARLDGGRERRRPVQLHKQGGLLGLLAPLPSSECRRRCCHRSQACTARCKWACTRDAQAGYGAGTEAARVLLRRLRQPARHARRHRRAVQR